MHFTLELKLTSVVVEKIGKYFYGSQVCVFMGFLCVHVSYEVLVSCALLFFLYFLLCLLCSTAGCVFLFACLFSTEKEKKLLELDG